MIKRALLFYVLCASSPLAKATAAETLLYRDSLVTVVQENRFHINWHTGDPQTLIVGGMRFPSINGDAPYYARVDGGRRILFSTLRSGGFGSRLTLVLRDIQTGRTQKLNFSDELWGLSLNSKWATMRDTVTQRPDGTLLLIARSFDRRREYVCGLEPFRLLNSKNYKGGKLIPNHQ